MIGLRQDANHIPFIREWVERSLALTRKTKTKGKRHDGKGATQQWDCTDTNWVMLSERYGLTPAHLEEFKVQLSLIETLPCLVTVTWMEDVCRRDA